MSTIGVVASVVALIICVSMVVLVLAFFRWMSRPPRDPMDDFFRELSRGGRGRRVRITIRRNRTGETRTGDDFERFFNDVLRDFAAERARLEENLRTHGPQVPQRPKRNRSWRAVLGVGSSATLREARAAFIKIAKATHPESAGKGADPARFQEAVEAYDAAQHELKN